MNKSTYLAENGVGDINALLRVYIANQPQYSFIGAAQSTSEAVFALEFGEIYLSGQACGNGWRKVFNVYAKFVYALSNPQLGDFSRYPTWQDYRDKQMLQARSNTSLLYTPPRLSDQYRNPNILHIVMGKTYANNLMQKNLLDNPDNMIWLNDEFAINIARRIIICPYFDYRQLSNSKILFLVNLIESRFHFHA